MVQRGHNFAIVDEVDSILIDEARTPLIISGPAEQSARWYVEFARIVPRLRRRRGRRGRLRGRREEEDRRHPRAGVEKVEDDLGIDNLYESVNTPLVGFLNNAIKAKELFKKDKDYVVMNGEVLIVDEFTGRMLHGRRYNEGMHQAIEAKEGVEIKDENQTLATITLQNYFRLYEKLVRHDRYRHDRGRRVPPDLQARRRADPDQPADDPRRRARPDLQDRGRQVRRLSSRTSPSATARASRCWSARSAWRSPRSSRSCSSAGASRTRC